MKERRTVHFDMMLQNRKGFSLIEVMIALVVISVGLVGLTSMFSQSFQTKRLSHDITLATLLAQETLEQLSLLPQPLALLQEEGASALRSFTDGNGTNIFPRFRWQAETERDQQGRITIRVHVYWPWPENQHHLHFATYAHAP